MQDDIIAELPINQIIHGDCVENMRKLPDKIASLVITDPPYGINYESRLRAESFGKIEGDGEDTTILSWSFAQCYRLLKDNSHFYTFTRWDVLDRFIKFLEYWGFNIKNCLIGARNAHSCGDLNYAFSPSYEMILFAHKGKRNFNDTTIKKLGSGNGYVKRFDDLIDWLPVNEPNKNLMFHPTQKSLELIEFFMLISSNEGDIVIDPFSGSGITAVAAWDLNRKFICYEINEEYHKKSLNYLDEFKRGIHNDILNNVHRKLGYNVGKVKQVTFTETFNNP
jgi:DNA modification methylase